MKAAAIIYACIGVVLFMGVACVCFIAKDDDE
jgi:hypothetical protein